MDYTQWFSQRLAQLRMQKGASARDMSLSLGQSESYINKIENRRAMPSMAGFFSICEYFEMEPYEFLNPYLSDPIRVGELQQKIGLLTPRQAAHVLQLVNDLVDAD